MPASPAKNKHAYLLSYMLLALVIIVLDQLTKQFIFRTMALHDAQSVTSFFSLVHAHNYGAAFGFLNNGGGWQTVFFAVVALSASAFIIRWLWQIAGSQRQLCLALALVLGGALGNLIDRVVFGFVIDFLSFHYGNWQFPAFNVADAAISVGAFLLILDSFGYKLIADYPGSDEPASQSTT